MDKGDAWYWATSHFFDPFGGEGFYRVSPLILRSSVDELLRRRKGLFDYLNVSVEKEGAWSVRTGFTIPATTSRPAKLIEATFLIVDLGGDVYALIASGDSATYAHSVKKIEDACYPLAIKPFVPIENSIRRFMDRFRASELQLVVMQVRGQVPGTSTKIQLFGRFDPDTALDRLAQDLAVPQSARLAGLNNKDEHFRVRLDTGCRLLVEQWNVDWTPLHAVFDLAIQFRESRQRYRMERRASDVTENSVTLVEFNRLDEEDRFARFVGKLEVEPGVSLYWLSQAQNSGVKVIDFLSGASCLIMPHLGTHLALQSDKPIHAAFTDRVRGVLSEIDQADFGGERYGQTA